MVVTPEETARTLVRRIRSEHEKWERRATELRAELDRAVTALLQPGARAWLIGTLAWGSFGPHSDVDIVVSGLGADAPARLFSELTGRLGVHVDVLVLEELAEPFRQRVLQEGVRLDGR